MMQMKAVGALLTKYAPMLQQTYKLYPLFIFPNSYDNSVERLLWHDYGLYIICLRIWFMQKKMVKNLQFCKILTKLFRTKYVEQKGTSSFLNNNITTTC
jgi:hypothetical protein